MHKKPLVSYSLIEAACLNSKEKLSVSEQHARITLQWSNISVILVISTSINNSKFSSPKKVFKIALNIKENVETLACNPDPPENTAHNRWFYQIHTPVIYSSLHITRTCQLIKTTDSANHLSDLPLSTVLVLLKFYFFLLHFESIYPN